MRRVLTATCLLALPLMVAHAAGPSAAFPVFKGGEGGYHTYRIPALITAKSGALLAFCEGRKQDGSDSGDIDLLVRRSEDGGRSWEAPVVVWNDADNTCGNPCPVLDEETGTLWLLLTWNLGADKEAQIVKRKSQDTRRVFVSSSTDDGRSWAAPREITRNVKLENWTWYATGPGVGIQLREGPHRARMIIPCDHIEAESEKYFSHVIYSDNHGQTWRLGGNAPEDLVNECQVAELRDGRLLLNMRNYGPKRARAVALSQDGGVTWTGFRHDPALPEPVCQASLIRYRGAPDCLLFSNPADTEKRINMTVRGSLDDGQTWPAARALHAGPAAYSCLVALEGGEAGILYEAGENHAYESIVFQRFPVSWVVEGGAW
jgi:sialidase-1